MSKPRKIAHVLEFGVRHVAVGGGDDHHRVDQGGLQCEHPSVFLFWLPIKWGWADGFASRARQVWTHAGPRG
jgi:hypothetical protein